MKQSKLNNLDLHKTAYISHLELDKKTRLRLIELGFNKGTKITPLYKSPLGDPTTYLVDNTVISLRKEDASLIFLNDTAEGVK